MKTTLLVLGSVWAILMALLAVGAGVGGDYTAVAALLISAALALPASWAVLHRYGVRVGRPVKSLIIIVTAVVGIGIGASNHKTTNVARPPFAVGTPAQAVVSASALAIAAKRQRQARQYLEAKNAAKITRLVADERSLDRDNIEARLQFWNEISALAPSNTNYAAQREELQAQVNEVTRLVGLPSQGAEVIKIRPHKAGFGNVLIVDVTIRNRGLSNLKDFQIRCVNSGPSGTAINSNERTLFDTVEARSTKMFRGLNMGFINQQTKSTTCEIMQAGVA